MGKGAVRDTAAYRVRYLFLIITQYWLAESGH